MAYFKNIHSLAELKKEYRRLALENHPDKGGRQMLQAMRMTMLEQQRRSMPTSYITSIVGKVATIKDSTLLRLWSWCATG